MKGDFERELRETAEAMTKEEMINMFVRLMQPEVTAC